MGKAEGNGIGGKKTTIRLKLDSFGVNGAINHNLRGNFGRKVCFSTDIPNANQFRNFIIGKNAKYFDHLTIES